MGPECLEPACASKEDMFRKAMGNKQSKRGISGGGGNNSVGAEASSAASDVTTAYRACPPDRDEIGRGSWNLVCVAVISSTAMRHCTLLPHCFTRKAWKLLHLRVHRTALINALCPFLCMASKHCGPCSPVST
eukprot:2462432-Pleurochrysis_carterae.AAC.4